MNKVTKKLPLLAKKGKNITILVVSTAIFTLSAAIIFQIIHAHDKLIINSIKQQNSYILGKLNNLEETSYASYKIRIKTLIESHTEIVSLFAQKDRGQLYEKTFPIYENFKKENPYFYVMHFHLPDGTTLLRMHNPDFFGDNLRGVRPIVDAAQQTHLQQSGFEVGRHGSFYRIVQPVYFKNKYIGCLEFGIQASQLVMSTAPEFSEQQATFFLQDEWIKATHSLNLSTEQPIGKFVLNGYGNHLFNTLPEGFDIKKQGIRLSIDNRTYIFNSWFGFKDFKGQVIGGIIFLQDISELIEDKKKNLIENLIIIFALTSFCLATLITSLNKLVKNITAAHKSLEENEAVLINAQKITHIGSCKYDLTTKTLTWSSEAYRILGVSPENHSPSFKSFLQFVHPEDRSLVASAYSDFIQNNTAYDITHRIIKPSSEERIVHQKAITQTDTDGIPISVIGTLHDITDAKESERSLQKSQKQWENTFNSIQDIITIQNHEMKIIKINKAGHDFFASRGQESLGQYCYQLFHGSDTPCPECPLLFTKETFNPYTKEIGHEKLGRTFIVSASAILNDSGELQDIIHVAKDITERKKFEEKLHLNEKMTTIAGLAAGVAHEVNNPLSAILQSQQVIEMRLDPDKSRNTQRAEETGVDLQKVLEFLKQSQIDKMIKNIRQSALNASNIIKSLLEFSRPNQCEINETLIVDLLEKVLQLAQSDYNLKTHYDLRNIALETEYGPEALRVPCVASEIKQVILNLIKNAAYFLVHNNVQNPKIKIRTAIVNDMARIEIIDNGPGIAENITSQIFDPFFTTKPEGEGMGLGLFISHTIVVDKHKGNMWVESILGEGATFVVELPLVAQIDAIQHLENKDSRNFMT